MSVGRGLRVLDKRHDGRASDRDVLRLPPPTQRTVIVTVTIGVGESGSPWTGKYRGDDTGRDGVGVA